MGILEALTGFLIAFKVFGLIHCSWWIVMAPEIVSCVIYIAILIVEIRKESRR